MEIICKSCNTKLNIPRDKIPHDQRVAVRCPKCKNKVILGDQDSTKKNPTSSVEENSQHEMSDVETDYTYEEDDASLDFYEEGVKLCLVLVDTSSQVEKIKQAIEGLGYKFVSAQNTREAIGKMRFHHFDMVILSEGFDNMALDQSPLLQYLNSLSMSVRRRMFVTLIGDSFKSMDQMMAFTLSVNLIINRDDLGRMPALLKHAVLDHKKFYKVFMDTLAEVGKA